MRNYETTFSIASILISMVIFSCQPKTKVEENTPPSGAYFSETASDSAQIFAEGIVSKEYQELNSVFSPDGKEFYYTIADPGRNHFYTIMMYTMNEDETWSGPEVAPFSGRYGDADPYITSDNKSLYFISRRPADASSTSSKDFDIWKVDRTDDGWSEAIRLDTTINTPGEEYYVSATDDGSIFYSARRPEGIGSGDIYQATPKDDGSYEITNLGEAINSPGGEGDPYVSPDGNMIIFTSWGREDEFGRGDLYISYKKDGEWQAAQNLGAEINTNSFEYCPMMSPDGKYFFWTSYTTTPMESEEGHTYQSYIDRLESANNGLGNVYWIKAAVLEKYRN